LEKAGVLHQPELRENLQQVVRLFQNAHYGVENLVVRGVQQELQVLQQRSKAIVQEVKRATTPEALYKVAVTSVQLAVQSDRVLLLQTVDATQFTTMAETTAYGAPALRGKTLPADCFGRSQVKDYATTSLLVLEDIYERQLPIYQRHLMERLQMRASLVLPLVINEQVWGLLLTAQVNQAQVDEAAILNRAADIIAQLQTKLGDRFDRDSPMPTSAELGFDMVRSMFEIGVSQRIEELSQALASDAADLSAILQTNAEIFLGLAESVELPGFAAIAQSTLAALNHHPQTAREIAQVALADFIQGREAVFAGDRAQGGSPSPLLQQWAASPEADIALTNGRATISSVFPDNQATAFGYESVNGAHAANGMFSASKPGSPLLKSLIAGSDSEVVIRFNALLAGGCSRG
jgi:GAF domain-containing protein